MGNRITEVRQRLVRGGIELQGIARSDRGTKYIEDSLVIVFGPDRKYPSKEEIQAGVKQLLEANVKT